ncbi:hypothetical protein A2U94_19185 [Bacillus sp. VT 712]|uniref:hypothetical protein n=1 Tax=Bacillaceae TaxID=186817 RepID=UPI00047352BE|nr:MULTISPECIES: hypothetical protein [Bacillaceae]KZB89876.1 hypothetical protein A2U94_19185 [Bacillus sp. VT 712]
MIKLIDIFQKEFDRVKDFKDTKQEFVLSNHDNIEKIFGYVFIINYFKKRAETKRYFGNAFNMTFSLLLESFYALVTGQCRSALLLLRSAQEANYRFVLERERIFMSENDSSLSFEPLDFRFIDTKRKFIKDLQHCLDKNTFKEYYDSIERNYTLYKQLSGVVHSQAANIPIMSVDYFSDLYKDTIIDRERFFKLFSSTLNEIFLLDFFLMRESLSRWDSFLLYEVLRTLYGNKRTNTLIKIVKNKADI